MSKESKKPKFLNDQSFLSFREKNEHDYIEKIETQNQEIIAKMGTFRNEQQHVSDLNDKLEKELKSLHAKEKKNSEKIEALKKQEIMLSENIFQLEKDYETQAKKIKKEGKDLDDENHKISQKMKFVDSTIKEKDQKAGEILAKIFELECSIKDVEKKQEKEKEKKICVVCHVEPSNYAFFPCGHQRLCQKCALSVVTCPICRKYIDMKAKIFD